MSIGRAPLSLGCIVRQPVEVEQAATLAVDYLELKGDMLCVDAAALADLTARVRATGLPAVSMTSPLPRRFRCRVVGADADHEDALGVFTDMCDRAAPFGVQTVVLGSGQARAIPAGFPRERAVAQFREFVVRAAEVCRARGMALTLEPLTAIETNFVNSCAEARPLVDELAGAGVRIAVDCYHIVSEGRSVAEEVRIAAGAIGHAHTSSLPRGSMRFHTEVQTEFVASLIAAGYTGGLTIEEDFTDFARQAPLAVDTFRRILSAPDSGTSTCD
ncbi:MAG TPA: sugar phosphate isomerase/epimerase [Micromonosporaceae bacterium]